MLYTICHNICYFIWLYHKRLGARALVCVYVTCVYVRGMQDAQIIMCLKLYSGVKLKGLCKYVILSGIFMD